MQKLIKKIKLSYELELVTGLHIGASKDLVEIGGVDSPVVRAPLKGNQPYIPGSSIKGKMRSLLEISEGKDIGGSEEVNKLFGSGAGSNDAIKSKLIVRDAYMTANTAQKLQEIDLPMPYTELKFENVINRVTGTAEHPRQMERVPAGSVFNVEFIVDVYEDDNEEELVETLKKGIKLLNADYLGGSGTRGYGHVRLIHKDRQEIWKNQ